MSSWTQVAENLVRYQGGTIYLRAKVAGKVVRVSLETSDLRIAKLKRDSKLDELRSAVTVAPSEVVTVGNALELVVKRVDNQAALKPATRRYYTQLFDTLRATLPLTLSGGAWTADRLAVWWKAYVEARSAQQANNALQMVRRVGEALVEAKLRHDNPASKLRTVKLGKSGVSDLPSVEEMDALIAEVRRQGLRCSDESASMIEFLAWSGMRIGELQGLKWEDVGETWLTVTGGDGGTKNGEQRRVPLNERLLAILESMRYDGAAGTVFDMTSPRGALDGACERLKMRHLRVHDLRHWFASHAIESGVDIPTVSRWLGHKDGGVLCMKTYGHLRDAHSLASMKKLVKTRRTRGGRAAGGK